LLKLTDLRRGPPVRQIKQPGCGAFHGWHQLLSLAACSRSHSRLPTAYTGFGGSGGGLFNELRSPYAVHWNHGFWIKGLWNANEVALAAIVRLLELTVFRDGNSEYVSPMEPLV
jgi:hypothetical protein